MSNGLDLCKAESVGERRKNENVVLVVEVRRKLSRERTQIPRVSREMQVLCPNLQRTCESELHRFPK
jgi:hypothetical protein